MSALLPLWFIFLFRITRSNRGSVSSSPNEILAKCSVELCSLPMNLNDPNQLNSEPKKSSAKKWLLGGCGCLTIIAVVLGIGAFMAYKSGKGFFGDMMNLAKAAEETMQAPEVIEAFGKPVEQSGTQQQSTSTVNGKSVTEITQGLKGPKGEGKLVMTMEQSGGSVMPKLSSAKIVTPDGTEIPIKLAADTAAPGH